MKSFKRRQSEEAELRYGPFGMKLFYHEDKFRFGPNFNATHWDSEEKVNSDMGHTALKIFHLRYGPFGLMKIFHL